MASALSRMLTRAMRRGAVIILIVAALGVGTAVNTAASSYTGTFTGYAYGNSTGASGYAIDKGDFANHDPSLCPNDPAASWAWGTAISPTSPTTSITLYDGSGNGSSWSTFYLYDNGDPTCAEGNYWADIYFGRDATSLEYNNGCPCSGSPSPGVCSLTSHSNCQDATNFGANTYTYTGP